MSIQAYYVESRPVPIGSSQKQPIGTVQLLGEETGSDFARIRAVIAIVARHSKYKDHDTFGPATWQVKSIPFDDDVPTDYEEKDYRIWLS